MRFFFRLLHLTTCRSAGIHAECHHCLLGVMLMTTSQFLDGISDGTWVIPLPSSSHHQEFHHCHPVKGGTVKKAREWPVWENLCQDVPPLDLPGMGDYLEAWKSRMLTVEVEVLLFECWNSTNKGIFGMPCARYWGICFGFRVLDDDGRCKNCSVSLQQIWCLLMTRWRFQRFFIFIPTWGNEWEMIQFY